MSMPVRSIDVARLAGVSRTTVSYVLNGRTDVSIPDETRQRVLDAASELGYRPNMAARALVMGRTGLISLWLVEGSTIRHQADVIQRIQRKVIQDGSELMMHRMSTPAEGSPASKTATDWHVDGVLAYNLAPHVVLPNNLPYPVVSFGSYYYPTKDYVGIDLKSGVVQAMHHLVSTGRRKIAYLVNRWGKHEGDDRYDAYTETMAHYGLEPQFIVASEGTSKFGREAITKALNEGAKFDALMCFSDELALGAYRALLDAGRSIPEDCALVGVDGIEELEYLEVPITTIVQPVEAMCRMAWDFLKNRLEDPTIATQQVVLPASLVIRESSEVS